MGKALKIVGADFSDVAVGTVTYNDPIPCTGLSLSPSSITFETVEETQQLIAIKAPADTTDVVTWASSDTNVASVVNGAVTVHGIGTVTITATCGTQIATVSINITSLKSQYSLKTVSDKSCYNASASSGGAYIALSTTSNETMVGQAYHEVNTDLLVGGGAINDIESVRIPYGATMVYIKTSDDVEVTLSYVYVASTIEKVTQGTTVYPAYLRRKDFFKTNTGYAVEYGESIIFRPGANKDISTLSYIYFE